MIKLSEEHPYKALNENRKPEVTRPRTNHYFWGWIYTDDRKPTEILTVYSNTRLSSINGSIGISLEFRDRDTAKEFVRNM